MATNKHATIRYHALDQCFSNPGRKYFINDLLEACNNALYEYNDKSEGIKKRQLYEDITFMESEQGWSIPLERVRDGKKVFYTYSDRKFSINNQTINESEAKQLQETLSILNRFKGMPQFGWMEEMLVRIESVFNIKRNDKPIVGFEQNPYLRGLSYFTELFNAIQYKKVLRVEYQSFKQENSISFTFHPYFLKQYNNRWFLFGYNEEHGLISNLSLDRIISIKEINNQYIENKTVNFEEYFEDVVGVSVFSDTQAKKIILKVDIDLWPYIKTKPLHGSQRLINVNEKFVTLELELQLNYELESLILSFGEKIEVIEPQELRRYIKNRIKQLNEKYF